MRFFCSKSCLVLTLLFILSLLSIPVPSVYAEQAEETATECCVPQLRDQVFAPASRHVVPVAATGVPQGGTVDSASAVLVNDGVAARIERFPGTDPLLVIDFGQVVSGYLQLATTGSNGAQLGIAMSESGKFLVKGSDFWGLEHGTYHWKPGLEQDDFETGQIAFRYVMLFLEEDGYIEIDSVSLHFTAFLGTPETFEGWFYSSDQQLNRIWYAGAYTLELSTIEVEEGLWTLVDGAKRDRHVWTGDLFLEGRIEYLTHNNPDLVRVALVDLAEHQREDGYIPPTSFGDYTPVFYDYAAWWVQTFVEYISHTGDLGFAETYYPHMEHVLAWFETKTGPDNLVIDDAGAQWSFSLPRTGALTYLNAIYYKALLDAATLAEHLDEPDDTDLWLSRAERVREAMNEHLFDNERGVYVVSDTDREHVPQDGNVLAVIYSIAPPERHQAIIQYLRDHHWTDYGATTVDPLYNNDAWHDGRIWPYMGYFELEARFMSGDSENAFDLIDRQWGHMLNSDPASTFWEWMTADGQIEVGFTSLVHGWSAGPTATLSKWVLGVRQTEYFTPRLEMFPHPGELEWAQGRVPTAYGPVDIAWWQLDDTFVEHVTVPSGTTAVVGVPVDSPNTMLQVNGETVWQDGQASDYNVKYDGDYLTIELAAGEYDLVASHGWEYYSVTDQVVAPVFQNFWEENGGLPVFGYPVGPVTVEWNDEASIWSMVQYFERQRFEHHPGNSGTPYEVQLGRLGAHSAEQSAMLADNPAFQRVDDPNSNDCRYFQVTGHQLCGAFKAHWERFGLDFNDSGISRRESLALFGYPISEAYVDEDTGLLTQYFERAVFEHLPDYPDPWNVLLRRLGVIGYVE